MEENGIGSVTRDNENLKLDSVAYLLANSGLIIS